MNVFCSLIRPFGLYVGGWAVGVHFIQITVNLPLTNEKRHPSANAQESLSVEALYLIVFLDT